MEELILFVTGRIISSARTSNHDENQIYVLYILYTSVIIRRKTLMNIKY